MLTTQPENKNTKKKMMYDLNIVVKFLREVQKEERKLENIPPEGVANGKIRDSPRRRDPS